MENGSTHETKRPTNAFYYFCQITKPDLYRERPELLNGTAPGEMNRIMGQRWKELATEEKKQWLEEFELEKRKWAVMDATGGMGMAAASSRGGSPYVTRVVPDPLQHANEPRFNGVKAGSSDLEMD